MHKSARIAGIAALAAVAAFAGHAPAFACNPTVTMSQVDTALAGTALKGGKLADANALRDDMAEALMRNDQRRAHHVETEVMRLMGYVESVPVSRGGCARTWRKAG